MGSGRAAAALAMSFKDLDVPESIKLIAALDKNAMGRLACLLLATLTFVSIALLRWPLLWVLLGLGGLTCTATWFILRRRAARVGRHGDAA